MDERFEQVTEKMDALLGESSKVLDSIIERFDEVAKTQDKLQKQSKSIEEKLDKAMIDFHKSLGDLFDEFRTDHKSTQSEWSETIKEAKRSAETIQKDYKDKVQTLIKSINDKSEDILSMHSELEAIRLSKESAETQFQKMASELKQQMIELQRIKQDFINNPDFIKVKDEVRKCSERLTKLEQYSHTHVFGGKKI